MSPRREVVHHAGRRGRDASWLLSSLDRPGDRLLFWAGPGRPTSWLPTQLGAAQFADPTAAIHAFVRAVGPQEASTKLTIPVPANDTDPPTGDTK